MSQHPIVHELRGQLQGNVLTENLEPYSRDFGNNRKETPLTVVIPNCTEDIVKTFIFARNNGIRVKTRGAGHTTGGQTLCSGGILLAADSQGRLKRTDRNIYDSKNDTLDVPSYMTWLDVTRELRK